MVDTERALDRSEEQEGKGSTKDSTVTLVTVISHLVTEAYVNNCFRRINRTLMTLIEGK
jgi:hypothetical protein